MHPTDTTHDTTHDTTRDTTHERRHARPTRPPATGRSGRPAARRAAPALAGPLLAIAVLVSGCATAADPAGPPAAAPSTATTSDSAAATATGSGSDGASAEAASVAEAPAHAVAVATGQVAVHERPDTASPTTDLAATTPLGTDRVLRVLSATADGEWLEVRVPSRPNNTSGWVAAEGVELRAVRHHVEIDLSERTLVLREAGEVVLQTTVAVGTADNPTPTGSFFVTDKLATDPDGAYGPHAIGIAAWSETLTEFAGGDGQIGIHGTNRPELLGEAVSHGCVRLSNDAVDQLASVLPLGVPVDIRA